MQRPTEEVRSICELLQVQSMRLLYDVDRVRQLSSAKAKRVRDLIELLETERYADLEALNYTVAFHLSSTCSRLLDRLSDNIENYLIFKPLLDLLHNRSKKSTWGLSYLGDALRSVGGMLRRHQQNVPETLSEARRLHLDRASTLTGVGNSLRSAGEALGAGESVTLLRVIKHTLEGRSPFLTGGKASKKRVGGAVGAMVRGRGRGMRDTIEHTGEDGRLAAVEMLGVDDVGHYEQFLEDEEMGEGDSDTSSSATVAPDFYVRTVKSYLLCILQSLLRNFSSASRNDIETNPAVLYILYMLHYGFKQFLSGNRFLKRDVTFFDRLWYEAIAFHVFYLKQLEALEADEQRRQQGQGEDESEWESIDSTEPDRESSGERLAAELRAFLTLCTEYQESWSDLVNFEDIKVSAARLKIAEVNEIKKRHFGDTPSHQITIEQIRQVKERTAKERLKRSIFQVTFGHLKRVQARRKRSEVQRRKRRRRRRHQLETTEEGIGVGVVREVEEEGEGEFSDEEEEEDTDDEFLEPALLSLSSGIDMIDSVVTARPIGSSELGREIIFPSDGASSDLSYQELMDHRVGAVSPKLTTTPDASSVEEEEDFEEEEEGEGEGSALRDGGGSGSASPFSMVSFSDEFDLRDEHRLPSEKSRSSSSRSRTSIASDGGRNGNGTAGRSPLSRFGESEISMNGSIQPIEVEDDDDWDDEMNVSAFLPSDTPLMGDD